jgi:hypothetical protein
MNRRDLLLGSLISLIAAKRAEALSAEQQALLLGNRARPNYFVNSAIGNDSNDGKSRLTPWKTIAKVNASTFVPGDVIGFCGGQNFTDALVVPSSGSTVVRIVFTSYGLGNATITPSAANTPGITCLNHQYITVRDLVIVGQSATTDLADGVHFENSQAGNTKLQNISLINLTVSQFNQNGIMVLGSNGTSGFNNVVIANCIAHDCTGGPSSVGLSGIVVTSQAGYGQGITAPSHTNVNISNCITYNNLGAAGQSNWTGSGIHIAQTGTGLIQNCVSHDNGSVGTGSVGIWFGDSTNGTIQFCEAYNQGSSTANDGDGFDLDGGCTNCMIQYNYSHNNKGAGVLLYAYADGQVTTWNNNTCRYHISENDGVSGFGVSGSSGGISIQQDATMTNVFVYNNVIYSNVGRVLTVRNSMTGNVANNIFYAGASNNIVFSLGATALNFTGNDYFSTGTFSISWNSTNYTTFAAWQTATGLEKIAGVNVGLTSDPVLVNPGAGGTVGGYNPSKPIAYELFVGSPAIGTGLDLNAQFSINPGSQDFYGNTIPRSGVYPVGAYAGVGSIVAGQTMSFLPANATSVPNVSAGSHAALQWERTQAWTAIAKINIVTPPTQPSGSPGAVIFTTSNQGSGTFQGYEFWIDGTGKLRARIINNIGSSNYIGVIGTTNVCDGTLRTVAVSYDGSSTVAGVKIYVNGVLETMTSEGASLTATIVNAQPFIIGNQTGWPFSLGGTMAEFSLSNVARSQATIAAYTTAAAAVDASTVLAYNFSENGGTTIADLSGNGFTGTVNGAQFPSITTPYVRQDISKVDLSGNPFTSYPVSLPSAVTSGSTVLVTALIAATGSITVADDKGNTYTQIGTNAGLAGVIFSYFYAVNVTNAPKTFTMTTSSGTYPGILVAEVANIAAVSPLDGHADQYQATPGTGTDALTSGSFTTTANGDFIYGVCAFGNTIKGGTGFNELQGQIVSEWQIQTTAGAIASTFTQAVASQATTAGFALKHA